MALLIVGALGGTAGAAPPDRAIAQALVDAVAHQDAAAFARLAPSSVGVDAIWFDAPDCAKQFSGMFVLPEADYPGFLKCLATLGLRVMPSGGDPGPSFLLYDPGVRLDLDVYRGELANIRARWLGEPAAVPITQDALASHAISGARDVEPDPAVREAVAQAPDAPAFVELTTCVDRTGKLESARIRRRSAGYDGYVHAVEAMAAGRRFKPFTAHGKPVRVCALELFTYPSDRGEKALPSPPFEPALTPAIRAAEDAVAQAVLDAITRQDAATFAKLVPSDAVISSIWFDSPPCAKQFSGSFAPSDANRPALLKCLSGLGLRLGPHLDSFRGVAAQPSLIYEPGVALELEVRGGVVAGIDTVWKQIGDPAVAPITSEALESRLVSARAAVEPDPEVRDALASSSPYKMAFAQLKVCVDATGKLESIRTVWRSKEFDSYVHAVEAEAAKWKFTPFKVHDKAVRVCALDLSVYPPDRKKNLFEPPPPPPPPPPLPPPNVSPTALEALRIAGNKNIAPDDVTKAQITASGKDRLIGSFKLCISTSGDVTRIVLLKSTGFQAYDALLHDQMMQWKYKPFTVNGKSTPVCTAVTFIYSQHDAPPALPPAPPRIP